VTTRPKGDRLLTIRATFPGEARNARGGSLDPALRLFLEETQGKR
jgi:hypothetical protein